MLPYVICTYYRESWYYRHQGDPEAATDQVVTHLRVQVDIHCSQRFLFRKVFIPKGHCSESSLFRKLLFWKAEF